MNGQPTGWGKRLRVDGCLGGLEWELVAKAKGEMIEKRHLLDQR